MKCKVAADEWYPFYELYEDCTWGEEIDIPRELFDEWEVIKEKLTVIQSQFGKLEREAVKKRKLEDAKKGVQPKGF